ncbi:MAG: four helix bundle protein [Melioribacteraceae bacterium]|nr:four helix bundle protein [Melioribacteraceae bacterium]
MGKKESMQLTVDIYKLFKDFKDYGFKDQIQRSAVSIPSNIAEGYVVRLIKSLYNFYL